MTDHELKIVDAMERFGGSFVVALANAFRHADRPNFNKLKHTFSTYWLQYERVAITK